MYFAFMDSEARLCSPKKSLHERKQLIFLLTHRNKSFFIAIFLFEIVPVHID